MFYHWLQNGVELILQYIMYLSDVFTYTKTDNLSHGISFTYNEIYVYGKDSKMKAIELMQTDEQIFQCVIYCLFIIAECL